MGEGGSCQTEGGIKDKVRSMNRFTDSSRAIACRETLCLVKGCTVVKVRYGGVVVLRCRESTRRLGGHGGLKIMKRIASFTSLV